MTMFAVVCLTLLGGMAMTPCTEMTAMTPCWAVSGTIACLAVPAMISFTAMMTQTPIISMAAKGMISCIWVKMISHRAARDQMCFTTLHSLAWLKLRISIQTLIVLSYRRSIRNCQISKLSNTNRDAMA